MPGKKIVFLEDRPRPAVEQMEIDHCLLERMGTGWNRLLRTYRFSGFSVTVGRTFRMSIPPEWEILSPVVAVRPTGGGAVLHQDDFCLSLFVSPRPACSPRSFYPLIHGWIGKFLGSLSVNTMALKETPLPAAPLRGLCFDEPVCGDLLWKSRKVLGGALRITSKGILYQGSLSMPGFSGICLENEFSVWYGKKGETILVQLLQEEVRSCPA